MTEITYEDWQENPTPRMMWVWNCEWGSGFTINQLKGKDYLWKEIVLLKEIKND